MIKAEIEEHLILTLSRGKSSKFVLLGEDTAVSESLELLSFLDCRLIA